MVLEQALEGHGLSPLAGSEAGVRVNEGTASLGPDPDSALRRRLAAVRPAADVRMLADVRVGDTGGADVRVPAADIDAHLPVITEPLQAYTAAGPRAVPFNRLVDAFRAVEPAMIQVRGDFVGLYGAIEVQALDGPVLADRDYRVEGRVLALSETPKTELIWYEATLAHAAGVAPVASFLHMSRLLKASSPLWA